MPPRLDGEFLGSTFTSHALAAAAPQQHHAKSYATEDGLLRRPGADDACSVLRIHHDRQPKDSSHEQSRVSEERPGGGVGGERGGCKAGGGERGGSGRALGGDM